METRFHLIKPCALGRWGWGGGVHTVTVTHLSHYLGLARFFFLNHFDSNLFVVSRPAFGNNAKRALSKNGLHQVSGVLRVKQVSRNQVASSCGLSRWYVRHICEESRISMLATLLRLAERNAARFCLRAALIFIICSCVDGMHTPENKENRNKLVCIK